MIEFDRDHGWGSRPVYDVYRDGVHIGKVWHRTPGSWYSYSPNARYRPGWEPVPYGGPYKTRMQAAQACA